MDSTAAAAGMTAGQIDRRDFTYCTAIWHDPYRWEEFVVGTPVLADARPRALAYATGQGAEPDVLMLDAANKVVQARKAFADGRHDGLHYESPPGRKPRKEHARVVIREYVPEFPCRICRTGSMPRSVVHEECEQDAAAMAVSDRSGILLAAGFSAEPTTIEDLLAAGRAVIDSFRAKREMPRVPLIRSEAAWLVGRTLNAEAERMYLELCAAEERDARHWRWTAGRGKPGVGLAVITASYNPHGWRVRNLARSWPEYEICGNIVRSGPPGCPRAEWRVETRKWHYISTGYSCERHLPDCERPPSSAEVLGEAF